jgi:hypothetical protein
MVSFTVVSFSPVRPSFTSQGKLSIVSFTMVSFSPVRPAFISLNESKSRAFDPGTFGTFPMLPPHHT